MNEEHPLIAVYELLAHLGVNPQTMVANYQSDHADSDPLFLAFPESKVGLAPDLARVSPLVNDGWSIIQIPDSYLMAFSQTYRQLQSMVFESIRRESQKNQVKTGSKEEERMMAAILRANLPVPDRNLVVRRENGKELTVPDFAWEEYKVAFYMDGLWWHKGMDDKRMMEALSDAADDDAKKKRFLDAEKSRAQKDADNRSELASMGWIVLSCTDADVQTDEGARRQADRIAKTLRSAQVRRTEPVHSDDLSDLF